MGTLRDSILAADDLPREQVQTDEWAPFGVPFVYIRGLTSQERDAYEQSLLVTVNGNRVPNTRIKNIRAAFVARVLVNDQGEREFTDKDVDLLGMKNAAVIDRLWDVGRKLSGMVLDEEEANPSTGDQDDSPSSDSPSPSE